MNQFKLKLPGIVYSGNNALSQIAEIITDDIKKVAIFSDDGVIKAGLLDIVLEKIGALNISYEIVDGLPAEPSCDQAQEIINKFRELKADMIVAVGGGSVMDIAKLASVLTTDAYTVKDLLDNPKHAKKQIPTLMIPTTAGTGSEATPNSIVLVPENELKVGIVNEAMIADYVILDAVMIKNIPRSIAAVTGIDALAHAIECFTSNKANTFSDLYALEALAMILENIEPSCNDSDNIAAKEAMLIASFYAGIAIASSGTTAVHALSYPLGGKFHIPHGVSNAMMLVPVMKFNEPVCQTFFAKVYDRLIAGDMNISIGEKSAWLIKRLDEIVKNLDIPTNLDNYGVTIDDLDFLVESGMQVTRLLVNNRREVTAEDAKALYKQLM